MKRIALTLVLLVATPVMAQQQPPSDPALAVCQQISAQKEGQLIQLAVQAQNLTKQLEDAKAELAKLKEPQPKP